MTERVDVLLPVSRDRAHLERALRSVEAVARTAGERLEIEVHAVDARDGRTPGAARNEAAAKGQAPYIALLDDDDLWLEGRLEESIASLKARPEVVLVSGDAELGSGGGFLPAGWRSGGLRLHRDLALTGAVAASTVTLRRTDWEAAGGMDTTLRRAEDFHMWLRLSAGGRPILIRPRPLARLDDLGPGLSRDPVAMATATLQALDAACVIGETDPAMRDRRGRLRATVAHGAADPLDQAAGALLAIRDAPGAAHAWTALGKAGRRWSAKLLGRLER